MGQSHSTKDIHNINANKERKVPNFTEAQICLTDESVIRPNGYFPPEIIVFILKYADFITCTRASETCKLWYESIQQVFKNMYISRYSSSESLEDDWKVHFYRRTLAEQNLAKGLWWAESVSAQHYPGYDFFSYVASFEGNKMIYNVHHLHITSYSDEKFYSAAYELDLDTMNVTKVPYGTIYANGHKLKALVKDNTDSLNWLKYDIIDNSTTTTITRKFMPPINEQWRRQSLNMHVNVDGSPRVLTTNFLRNNHYDEPYTHYMEVVDLKTGDIIAQPYITDSTDIILFIGDFVIADQLDGVFLVNIFTNERIPLGQGVRPFHFCKETNLFGYCTGTLIKLCHWPTLEVVAQIDVASALPEIQLIPSGNEEQANKTPIQIVSLAFDKSKLVAALLTSALSLAVFDMHTGALIQTIYNTSDSKSGKGQLGIHLAPNGKIVTSFDNLVVYDFLSPKILHEIPVIFAELKSNEVTKTYVPAKALAAFAVKKLEAPLETIQHLTFQAQDKQGRKYRMTGIGSHYKDKDSWDVWSSLDWPQMPKYLCDWSSDCKTRNTFQLTNTKYNMYPETGQTGFEISWGRLRKVLLVHERLNEVTGEWEFAEPLAHDEVVKYFEESDEEED